MLKIILINIILFFGNVNLSDLSFYEILGVTKKSTTPEIKQAYKKLAIKLHPDKNSNSADQQKFLKITEAYETLRDPEKRHKYNLYGSQQSYTRNYDFHSQTEYNNLYYNGLYHNDPFVATLSAEYFFTYLNEGFYFINFYSPFCPPCQGLADHWKKLAEVYKGIIKVGAVNCKHYNSFCYHNMRVGSYPTLLFYPDGKDGGYIYYGGAHRFDSLEEFVITYVKSKVPVPHVTQMQNGDQPVVYVVDGDSLGGAVVRIAYQLKGLATVVTAGGNVRRRLTNNPHAVIVFKYKQIYREIENKRESDIVKEIVDSLPRLEKIGSDKLKNIRSDLRDGRGAAWALCFTKSGDEYLSLHQLKATLPHLHFGEIDCDTSGELCTSLQVEDTPAVGVLKPGGAYQRLWGSALDARLMAQALNLHTLSPSDLNNILNGDMSTWVLLVAPHQSAWQHAAEPFARASLQFTDTGIHFGIMACTESTAPYCSQLAQDQPVLVVQNRTSRHAYNGRLGADDIIQFIQLLKDTSDLELSENQAMEIASRRDQSWVIAYLPADCGDACDRLLLEWRLAAHKLRPLRDADGGVRAGAVRCGRAAGPLCGNVRAPAARLYRRRAREHYAVSLQRLSQAPHMLQWVFDLLADSIHNLNWKTFSKLVISEDLNPKPARPWLVYYHSPRCSRCYQMFPEFAIASVLLKDAAQYGKVNCAIERGLCRHERVSSYPALRLYLPRRAGAAAGVLGVAVREYSSLLRDIAPHLANLDLNINTYLHDEL